MCTVLTKLSHNRKVKKGLLLFPAAKHTCAHFFIEQD